MPSVQVFGWMSSSRGSLSLRSFAQTVDQMSELNVAVASARKGVEDLRSTGLTESNEYIDNEKHKRPRNRVRTNRVRKHIRKLSPEQQYARDFPVLAAQETEKETEQSAISQVVQITPVNVSQECASEETMNVPSTTVRIILSSAPNTEIVFTVAEASKRKMHASSSVRRKSTRKSVAPVESVTSPVMIPLANRILRHSKAAKTSSTDESTQKQKSLSMSLKPSWMLSQQSVGFASSIRTASKLSASPTFCSLSPSITNLLKSFQSKKSIQTLVA